jgi:hypothetical protein
MSAWLEIRILAIGWNSLDALAALISGLSAGSAARVGFGLDTLTKLTPAWPCRHLSLLGATVFILCFQRSRRSSFLELVPRRGH